MGNLRGFLGLLTLLILLDCTKLEIIDSTATTTTDYSFTLGSFNVQNYGTSKSSHSAVMKILVKIVSNYDLFAMQELEQTIDQASTNTGVVIRDFLDRMNAANSDAYALVASPKVDTTEQYIFLYKKALFKVISSTVYSDPNSKFARPPFILRLKHLASAEEFYLVTIHTKPSAATAEIYALEEVADSIKNVDQDVIFLGDFNSDGTYFNETIGWPAFNLIKQGYTNLIADNVDTTVATGNSYTYDRIMISPSLNDNVVSNTAKAFYFDDTGLGGYDLSEIQTEGCSSPTYISNCPASVNDAAKEVSDHYPVQVILKMTP